MLGIYRAIHTLPEPYREVFLLRATAELRFSEIGAIFGKSETGRGSATTAPAKNSVKGCLTMNCDVIRDLLPSYADGICSPASQTLVQEHLAQCPACQKALEQMRQPRRVPATPRPKIPCACSAAARSSRCCWPLYSPQPWWSQPTRLFSMWTRCTVCSSPSSGARVENATDWTPVQFETGEFLVLDSPFYDKAVTNDANSACAAQIRVLDADGNLVVETPAIAPGTSAQLSMLERDTPYRVEVLADLGSVILTFH